MEILLTVVLVGLREHAREYYQAEGTWRGEPAANWNCRRGATEGPLGRHCSLREMKLLTQMLCQSRGGLGRNPVTYYFCHFLPLVKPKQQSTWPGSPGDAVLADQFAEAQAAKSKERIWEGQWGEGGMQINKCTLDHCLF